VSSKTRCAAFALALILVAGACSSDDQSTESSDGTYRLQALSTRPEYVTGGDVLVGIDAPGGAELDGMTVTVDGRDVSSAFSMKGDRLVGLVDGLGDGSSTIVAERDGARAELEVVNHLITGPLFSGPHLEPFVCKTEMFGLGPPTDDNCSAPTQSRTEDVGGVSATVERGVIDRSIYTIVFPESGWNGRLVYRFGGGCGTSYSQGSSLVNAVDAALVQKGYAVVTSTLNTYQSVCNEVLSAEVALMTKEHFTEEFGVPEFTIGEGGSGGAIQQLQVAQNYPGILDAIAPAVPFADALSTAPTVTDCGLLLAYFATPGGASFSDEQQRAVSGHRNFDTCRLWARSFLPNIDPTVGCDPAIQREEIYDPQTNRDGVRCTLQDSVINLTGTDPTTGFAARPLDNTGVVYGRGAFDESVISFEQLVDLNASIGGYDIDGKVMPTRSTAPDSWFEAAYATGRVTEGGGLVDVPILLTNIYTDALGDIHDRQRAFSIRERLATAEGAHPENVVVWTFPSAGSLTQTLSGAVGDTSAAIEALDRWLTAARADTGSGSWSDKLARNRPGVAVDTCVLASGERLTGDDVYTGSNACTDEYPVAADARRVAGAPLRDDILKCQKVALDASYFERQVTDEQLEPLRAIFPDGVCDWSRPGVGQVPLSGTWLEFAPREVEPS
jgi:hypothetical protein